MSAPGRQRPTVVEQLGDAHQRGLPHQLLRPAGSPPAGRVTSTFRTARCGPACRVVWEGPSEISRHPYPDCYHPADDVPAEQVRRLDHLLYGAEVLDHHRRRPADDLQKGVTFYDAGVGLTPVRRLGDFAVELAGAQAPVFLPLKAPSTPAFTLGRRPRATTADTGHRCTSTLLSMTSRPLFAGPSTPARVPSHRLRRIRDGAECRPRMLPHSPIAPVRQIPESDGYLVSVRRDA